MDVFAGTVCQKYWMPRGIFTFHVVIVRIDSTLATLFTLHCGGAGAAGDCSGSAGWHGCERMKSCQQTTVHASDSEFKAKRVKLSNASAFAKRAAQAEASPMTKTAWKARSCHLEDEGTASRPSAYWGQPKNSSGAVLALAGSASSTARMPRWAAGQQAPSQRGGDPEKHNAYASHMLAHCGSGELLAPQL